jgi:peptide/nickel transport system permease protein
VNVKAVLSNPRAIVGASILGFFIIIALFAPVISPYSPSYNLFPVGLGPSAKHWLGTTEAGNDILSQLIWGTRQSLSVGLLAGFLICLVQLVMGVFSGYVGGVIDTFLAAVTNIFLVLPALPLLIVLSAYLQGSGGSGSTPVLIGVITITGWAWGARVLRSQAIALRDRPFVEAARISGESRWHIVLSHIVPNMLGIMVANFFGAALFAVLAEAGLEFIGLGNVFSVSWGTMLYWAQNDEATLMGLWLWLLLPGLCILLLGTALGLLNFAIDEIANPNLRRD